MSVLVFMSRDFELGRKLRDDWLAVEVDRQCCTGLFFIQLFLLLMIGIVRLSLVLRSWDSGLVLVTGGLV